MGSIFQLKFIRNFTLESIEVWLSRELREAGLQFQLEFGGFATAADEIRFLTDHSNHTNRNSLIVLAMGLEMTAEDFGHTTWAAEAACERHLILVRSAIEASHAPLVINTVLPPLFCATGMAIIPGGISHSQLIDELNIEIRKLATEHPGRVILVDWVAFARELGEKGTYDYRFWHTSGAPFATPFLMRYAAGIASVVRVLSGKARKCLAIDCDNTIWGGVVGEEGRNGIDLSSDSLPGAYFLAFQRSVLDLHRRGIAIALCSKNNESDVLDVLDRHPYCLIKREHLATWRINWNEKAQSIVEIAEELNVGLDSIVFVDDSSHECEIVRSALPDVTVLQIPKNSEDVGNFLARQFIFDSLVVTNEDTERTRSYQQNRSRTELSKTVPNLHEYKKQLETTLALRLASNTDVARMTQLLQRTNQFNLTTRRYDQVTVSGIITDSNMLVVCADLKDKFGNLGLIGVSIVKNMVSHIFIDALLISCRALGRDAELAFGKMILKIIYAKWGEMRVLAEYIPTAKNTLVADFWSRIGFSACSHAAAADGRAEFVIDIDLSFVDKMNIPDYIKVMDLTNER